MPRCDQDPVYSSDTNAAPKVVQKSKVWRVSVTKNFFGFFLFVFFVDAVRPSWLID